MVELSLGTNSLFLNIEERFNSAPGNIQNMISVLEKKIPGSEFTGWMGYDAPESSIKEILDYAKEIRQKFEKVIVIGIGGSYLGSKASLDFLDIQKPKPLSFCGYNLSPDTYAEILKTARNFKTEIIVISKSGTTLEPSIALRMVLSEFMKNRDGAFHVTAITDSSKGILKKMADENGWKRFSIPDDIGGRFSVITPVGLIPLAVSGADINAFLESFTASSKSYSKADISSNSAILYSFARFNLLLAGYINEVFVTWQERCIGLSLWWQQLFGECEGKEGKGLYPSVAHCTRDLHSIGQYLQEGRREIFETFFHLRNDFELSVPGVDLDDKLDYLAGKKLSWINRSAREGTRKAHEMSGRPVISISVEKSDEKSLGDLFAFFMYSAAFSSRFLGLNAFDQPGVEAYKREMSNLLKEWRGNGK
ncbi:glucose-6-phosphate isomerase [candidate division WOR-3 bacterium]|nr:glucose-6-phosphate isomerase [candidate division WOR-3 bacterium]